MQALAFAAPVSLCVAVRRSRARDVAVCALQMWAYLAAYETPHDDAERQRERVHIDYPIAIDRVLGLGELPTVRLQRALARTGREGPEWRALDAVLVWAHWIWFLVPHTALAYVLVRRPERFPRAAVMTYAVFDLGACVVLAAADRAAVVRGRHRRRRPLPIPGRLLRSPAPRPRRPRASRTRVPSPRPRDPAGSRARGEERDTLLVRRMMVEYGEHFWQEGWGPLFSALGGNPLAAMPSLHVASSAMAGLLLCEVGPIEGAIGWSYAFVLAFALVYLGEHYVIDLLAGVALTAGVYRYGPRAAPLVGALGRAVSRLEALAHADT